MNPTLIAFLVWNGIAVTAATAAEKTTETYRIEEVRVDGARLTNDRRSVRVIGESEIRGSNAVNLGDLLRRSAGVDFASNFSGSASSAIRGGDPSHTLVIVDGVKVNDPTNPTRTFDFSLLDLSQVERIEIFKGPQSVTFGSDALSGVIVITTKKAGLPRTDLTAVGGTGAREAFRASLAASGNLVPALSLGANLSFDRSEGASAAKAANGDEDITQLMNAGASAELTPITGHVFEAGWNGKLLDQDLDAGAFRDDPNSESRTLEHELHARYTATLSDKLEARVIATRKTIRRSYDNPADPINTSAFDSIYRGANHGVDAQVRVSASDAMETVLGGEWTQERMKIDSFSSPSVLAKTKTETWSGFAQNRLELVPGLTNDLGFRYDNSSNFAATRSVRAGLQWIVSPAVKSTLAFGTGFKSPTLFALYAPLYGNADLRPEQSRSIEAGVEFALPSDSSLLFHVHQTRYKDLISYDPSTFVSMNIDAAEVRGAEAEVRLFTSQPLSFTLHGTYLRAFNRLNRSELPKRARFKGGAVADWNANDRLHFQSEFLAKTSRRDSATSLNRVPGFGVWHLSGDYRFTDALKATVRLENVLDQDEFESLGYTPRGRMIYAGAQLSF